VPLPDRFRAGLRASVPYAAASFLLSFSFGAVAVGAGFPALAAVVMSAVVYAGSAQFAALAVLSGGGSLAAAVGASTLMNSRFLPMGVALGPSLPGGRLVRAVQGQPVVDSSWALAARGDGRFDRLWLFGHSAGQYAAWTTGTALSVLLAGTVDLDVRALGLDAVFPAFFLALLAAELKKPRGLPLALVGGGLALALVPLTPPGVPVLAASLVALVGLRRPR
jgi:4-azaleucine resistance transporter AzlC